ncbi:hypothetical protein I302_108556 [Kwoniella bestiolae CBS 10118]|uniref:Zn(2)-C6 fungal-type domain-containing protein n=1 Tax=Kwoniella bestiolae CBS 10118 TaxID=1296100 RepID=A0A1B9FVF0_9TREE|nr:hypothetical protein I302_07071 [Kwoniella bestiolae CBS 10118]OCF22731.1 hypothetical protein I302_07071 [Kwoniella bestiolae CBS 10118]
MGESSETPPPAKRRKARRACDSCRNRKLRCEYPEEDQTQCVACRRSKSLCESTQPAKIDKRRLRTLVDLATTDEQKQWVAAQIASRGIYVSSTDTGALRKARPSTAGDPIQLVARLSSPSNIHSNRSSISPNAGGSSSTDPPKSSIMTPNTSRTSHRPDDPPQASTSTAAAASGSRRNSDEPPNLKLSGPEPRMQGPTATINLLADLPEDSAALDRRYGLFRVTEGWVYGANPDIPMREGQMSEQQVREDVIAKLISFYTDEIAPLNAVIPPHRIPASIESSSFVLASILAVAALSRDVPSSIYTSIRHKLTKELDSELGKGNGSTLQQVQGLLISGMSHELHGETNMEGGSNCWIRIGTAIRQAQDIGLHRLNSNHWLPEMFADRARAWLAAIITDRWYGGAFGQPLAINLLDCEDPLESADLLQTSDLTHAFQVEMYHISCLLGDIMQIIYRPRSLDRCTDDILESLLRQIDSRLSLIPEPFLFSGESTSVQGGLLRLVTVSTEVIFFRSFVKHNRKLPSHLTFRPTAQRWSRTVQRARQAISWMNQRGDHILDCWLIAKYAIVYAALAQYYNYAAERDLGSLQSLSTAKDMMNRWALGHHQQRPIAARAKIADIVNLFYKAALGMGRSEPAVNTHSLVTPSSTPASAFESSPSGTHDQSHTPARVVNSSRRPQPNAQDMDRNETIPTLDTSTLDDWLADFFRQHDIPDVGLSTSAMYQGGPV